ncbi:hypothetical protein E4U15_002551 [Claviceps sp. LM218 group G6]|nr:hypothetical protein E4U15_002550 [Claviceps sp. LM218 group G6]KAG6089520.1 hypothetical protein E4U15_002551 [Claviceps sp. LM218 group G6]
MADQLERNLNNDTADFRAHQAALNLTQTNRPKNTSRNYDSIAKEWRKWCSRYHYEDGDLVHERKLVRFTTEEIINRLLRKQKKKRKRNQKEEDDNDTIDPYRTRTPPPPSHQPLSNFKPFGATRRR